MKSINRRNFILKSAGAAGCLLLMKPELFANHAFPFEDKVPNPAELNYCGYKCPDNCPFRVASEKNDPKLKKEAYDQWNIKETRGVDFEADKIFCFGCKNKEKPEGIVLTGCTVRSCAIEKKLDSCVQCEELAECKKDLWDKFPKFKEQVIKMQEVYFESKI